MVVVLCWGLLFGPTSTLGSDGGPPSAEAARETVEYVGPGMVFAPAGTGPVGLPALDATCAPACPGGTPQPGALATLPPATFDVTLRLVDDLSGQEVWGALCLSTERDGACLPGDHIVGPVCGPFRAVFLPPPGEVLVYAASVSEMAPSCGDAVKGTATIDHAVYGSAA